MMDFFVYYPVLLVVKVLQALPLRFVARLGRRVGALAYWLDGRHRRVATENLRRCFPEKSMDEVRELARENFRRLGENYCSAIKTATMTDTELLPHFEVVGMEEINAVKGLGAIIAIGHFGNFELYTRITNYFPGLRLGTTYRALNHKRFDALLHKLRSRPGFLLYERRANAKLLLRSLKEGNLVLGLLCDQRGGRRDVRAPFLGHECSTNAASAVLAQRYSIPLHTGICYRVAPAKWRIEFDGSIPTRADGALRPVEEIMAEVNARLEKGIRRDPANWFWVHDRWKFTKKAKALARQAALAGETRS